MNAGLRMCFKLSRRVLRLLKRFILQMRDRVCIERLIYADNPNGKRLARVIRQLQTNKLGGGQGLIRRIEEGRKQMLLRDEPLIDDTLGPGGLYDEAVSVKRACSVSKPPKPASLIYLLIREFKPLRVLELGANVGISAAYQAVALKINNQGGALFTLEASPYRLRLAKELHHRLELENVSYKLGLFTDTLEQTLKEMGSVDFAFIDGHHLYQPTLAYFDLIWQYAVDEALFVFDDIRYSNGMKRAWSEIQADKRVSIAVDLYSVGVCVTTKIPSDNRYVTSLIKCVLH